MSKKAVVFYAFVVNEYHYKRISFSKHYSRIQAEKAAYRPYGGTAQSDLSPMILNGKDALIKWAEECDYAIDFEEQTLSFRGEE